MPARGSVIPTRFPSGLNDRVSTNRLGTLPMLDPTKYVVFFEDFMRYDSAQYTETATSVGAGTSALAVIDGVGGVARLTTAANENDGAFYEHNIETFRVATGKQVWIAARFQVGDAAQSDLIIGLHSTDTTPQDATYRALFESVDGSAALYFNVDDNTTDADSSTVATLADDTWIEVAAHWDGVDTITLWADGSQITSMTSVSPPGANDLAVGFGYLNGAAGAETTDFDYILVIAER